MTLQRFGKKGLSLALCGLMLTGASTVSAAEYECYKSASAAQWVKNRHPKGNWGPQHNTNKWSYAPVAGADIYRHRNGRRTVGTRCKGIGYDYGTHKIDFDGNQDWCADYVGSVQGGTSAPTCGSGYTLSADKNTCTKPGQAGYWHKNRHPQGNWGPQHNTSKWSYAAVAGADIYRHRNGRRTVGTRCKSIGYNHGTHKVDFVGNQDWCATYVNPTSARTVTAACPSGYQLRVKPAIGSTTLIKNSGISIKQKLTPVNKSIMSAPRTLQRKDRLSQR